MTLPSTLRRVAAPTVAVAAVAAVASVVAVLTCVWWLTHRGATDPPSPAVAAGSSTGSSTGSPTSPGAVPTDVRVVRVDSYVARGRFLTLHYTTEAPKCAGTAADTTLRETRASVTVTLGLPPHEELSKACVQLPVLNTVTVRLDRPLDNRNVFDGASDPPLRVPRVRQPYATALTPSAAR